MVGLMLKSFLAQTRHAGQGHFAPMTAPSTRLGFGTPTTPGPWATRGSYVMGAANSGIMINPVVQDHTAPTRRRR
jgi:hypothetical protein